MRSIVKWYIPISAMVFFAVSCNSSTGSKKSSGGKVANACNCSQYSSQGSANQSGYSGNTDGLNNSSGQSQGYTDQNSSWGNSSSNASQTGGSNTGAFLVDSAGKPTWEGTIQGIVNLKCISCHSTSSPSGGVDLSSYSAASAHSDRIVQTIQLPTTDDEFMPPIKSPQLTSNEKQSFLDWKNNSYEQGTSGQGTNPDAYQSGSSNNNYGNNNSTYPQNNNGSTYNNSADANSCSQICAGQSANSTAGSQQNFNNSSGQNNNGQFNNGQSNTGQSNTGQSNSGQSNFQQDGTSQGNSWGTP